MRIARYLSIAPDGITKLSAGPPRLGPASIALLLNIEIPDALFRKPSLQATITVPKEAGSPAEITAQVIANMADAVKQATGLTLAISVVPQVEDQP